jgi:hypothetical protein
METAACPRSSCWECTQKNTGSRGPLFPFFGRDLFSV